MIVWKCSSDSKASHGLSQMLWMDWTTFTLFFHDIESWTGTWAKSFRGNIINENDDLGKILGSSLTLFHDFTDKNFGDTRHCYNHILRHWCSGYILNQLFGQRKTIKMKPCVLLNFGEIKLTVHQWWIITYPFDGSLGKGRSPVHLIAIQLLFREIWD